MAKKIANESAIEQDSNPIETKSPKYWAQIHKTPRVDFDVAAFQNGWGNDSELSLKEYTEGLLKAAFWLA